MLNLRQLDIQDLFQVFALQRAEHNHLINAVHELGGKLAARRFHRRAIDLLIHLFIIIRGSRGVTQTTRHQLRHLVRSQIGCKKHQAVGKIHPPIVTQRKRAFVQDAQQQLPQRV